MDKLREPIDWYLANIGYVPIFRTDRITRMLPLPLLLRWFESSDKKVLQVCV